MAIKVTVTEKLLTVRFDDNNEPIYVFTGAWNIRDLGHTRAGMFRAYKHFMKGVRSHERADEGSQREGSK